LDKDITEELLLEGYARDIVRFVQESRKEADYHVADRIQLEIDGDEIIAKVVSKFKDYIEKETLSNIVDKVENPDLEKEVAFEDEKATLRLKK